MKRFLLLTALLGLSVVLVGCNDQPEEITPRAVYLLARVYVDDLEVSINETAFVNSQLRFFGEDTVMIQVGETGHFVRINPSREHPSFAQGYWHHHLYASSTVAGSPRINFLELLPDLNIDDNPDATDNTQSAYQRGNLHYIVATEEFRLRLTIDGQVHDLFFICSC